jgi:FkbM family methyltransferase
MKPQILYSLLCVACCSGAPAPGECPDDNVLGAGYTVAEVPEVGRFWLDDKPGLAKKFLRSGKAWEPHIVDYISKHVDPGSTVVDVGAHIGSITVPLAHAVGPSGRVYAFEPETKNHKVLCANVALNELQNVTVLRIALGDRGGTVAMETSPRGDGLAKVTPGDEVPLRTLDSFGLTDVSLIKIDVEGYGAHVLRGAEKTIHTSQPAIIIEIGGGEERGGVRELIHSYGYTLQLLQWHDHLALWNEEGGDG